MKIGIIGAGKVGTTIGAYLNKNCVEVSGYYSRTLKSAVTAADFAKTKAYQSLERLVGESDTLFITTPDSEIGSVWDCIVKYGLQGKRICHFSGSLSSNVFFGIEAAGAYGCSIHPMYAFSGKFTSLEQFHTACLTMEGQKEALEDMKVLFGKKLNHKIFLIASEDKIKYHAAATLASNYMVGLFQAGLDLLAECGFDAAQSRELLTPLVTENVKTILEKGTIKALTGPVERNDIDTVQKHLQVFDSAIIKQIYCSLGEELVVIAQKKHEDRDYSALQKILNRD